MSSYLFATVPEKGHLNPMIGTAQYLHNCSDTCSDTVTFSASTDISSHLSKAGLSFCPDLLSDSSTRPTSGKELVELVKNGDALHTWVASLLLDNLDQLVEQFLRCFTRHKPDVVVIDPLLYAPAIAAEKLHIPWVTLSNSLNPVLPYSLESALLTTVQAIDNTRHEICAEYGLSAQFRGCDILSPHLAIAFTTEAVSGYQGEEVRQVGPATLCRPRGDEMPFSRRYTNRPLVYLSFGSQIYYWPELFNRVILACEHLEVELVLSAGELVSSEYFRQAPDWVQVFKYAPQLAILEQSDLFITHGGANSFMESIMFGVPMILSPVCNDQFHQAWFVERRRLGKVVDVTKLGEHELSALLTGCLQSSSWYSGLGAATESYKRNGSRAAAELIRELC